MLIVWRKSVDPKLKNSILIESFWELLSSLQKSLLNHTRCPVVNTPCDDKILKCNQVIMESFGGLKIFSFFFPWFFRHIHTDYRVLMKKQLCRFLISDQLVNSYFILKYIHCLMKHIHTNALMLNFCKTTCDLMLINGFYARSFGCQIPGKVLRSVPIKIKTLVLFIMLYKVAPKLESVDEISKCHHSELLWAELFCGAV